MSNRNTLISDNEEHYILYVITTASITLFTKLLKLLDYGQTYDALVFCIDGLKVTRDNIRKGKDFKKYLALSKTKKPSLETIARHVDATVAMFQQQDILHYPQGCSEAIKEIVLQEEETPETKDFFLKYEHWVPHNNLAPNDGFKNSKHVFVWKHFEQPGRVHEFTGVLKKQKCRFRDRDDKRCKRWTVIGLGLCWQHLKLFGLMMAPSFDSNDNPIGVGLYPYGEEDETVFDREVKDTKANMKKNKFAIHPHVIAYYDGEEVDDAILNERYGNVTGPYSIRDDKNTKRNLKPMDAALQRGLGALVNHTSKEIESNATFAGAQTSFGNLTYAVVATKKIRASGAKSIKDILRLDRKKRKEILLSYGKDYRFDEQVQFKTTMKKH